MNNLTDEKEAFRAKTQAQIDQLEAEFKKMRARGQEMKADAMINNADRFEDIEQKIDQAKKKLADWKDDSESAWDDFKMNLEEMTADIRKNLS